MIIKKPLMLRCVLSTLLFAVVSCQPVPIGVESKGSYCASDFSIGTPKFANSTEIFEVNKNENECCITFHNPVGDVLTYELVKLQDETLQKVQNDSVFFFKNFFPRQSRTI